jgi:hypothetical protein
MICFENDCGKEASAMIVVNHTSSMGSPKECQYYCRQHYEEKKK